MVFVMLLFFFEIGLVKESVIICFCLLCCICIFICVVFFGRIVRVEIVLCGVVMCCFLILRIRLFFLKLVCFVGFLFLREVMVGVVI